MNDLPDDNEGGYLVLREYQAEILFRLSFPNTPIHISSSLSGRIGLIAPIIRLFFGDYYTRCQYDSPLFAEWKRRNDYEVTTHEDAEQEKLVMLKEKWHHLWAGDDNE